MCDEVGEDGFYICSGWAKGGRKGGSWEWGCKQKDETGKTKALHEQHCRDEYIYT